MLHVIHNETKKNQQQQVLCDKNRTQLNNTLKLHFSEAPSQTKTQTIFAEQNVFPSVTIMTKRFVAIFKRFANAS